MFMVLRGEVGKEAGKRFLYMRFPDLAQHTDFWIVTEIYIVTVKCSS